MTTKEKERISKFLSLVLRHRPDTIDLYLDDQGWAEVTDLLGKSSVPFTLEELHEVVATNDKKRFSFNADKTKIRANQGHSLKAVDLQLESISPPQFLYHGTVEKFITAIKAQGLKKMRRQHVHLSNDKETASLVGSRRGKPIILEVRTSEMHAQGYLFYKSANGVWLTDAVPPDFINFKTI